VGIVARGAIAIGWLERHEQQKQQLTGLQLNASNFDRRLNEISRIRSHLVLHKLRSANAVEVDDSTNQNLDDSTQQSKAEEESVFLKFATSRRFPRSWHDIKRFRT